MDGGCRGEGGGGGVFLWGFLEGILFLLEEEENGFVISFLWIGLSFFFCFVDDFFGSRISKQKK